jgi:hypothetical protein
MMRGIAFLAGFAPKLLAVKYIFVLGQSAHQASLQAANKASSPCRRVFQKDEAICRAMVGTVAHWTRAFPGLVQDGVVPAKALAARKSRALKEGVLVRRPEADQAQVQLLRSLQPLDGRKLDELPADGEGMDLAALNAAPVSLRLAIEALVMRPAAVGATLSLALAHVVVGEIQAARTPPVGRDHAKKFIARQV